MAYQDPIKAAKLYNSLLEDGYTPDNLGTEDEFVKALEDKTKAKSIYDGLIADGYTADNLGTEDEFMGTFLAPVEQPQPAEQKPEKKLVGKIVLPEWQSVDPTTQNLITDYFKKNDEIFSNAKNADGIAPSWTQQGMFEDVAIGKYLKESTEKLDASIPIPELAQNMRRLYSDFRGFAEDGENIDYAAYLNELKSNPESYTRHVAALKWQRDLAKAIYNKEGQEFGDQIYSRLISMQKSSPSYSERKNMTDEIIKNVRTYVDDTDKQEEIIKNIAIDRSASYGSQLAFGNENEYADNPISTKLNKYQLGYIDFLKSVDPLKASAFEKVLSMDPDVIRSHKLGGPNSSPELVIGYESQAREAEAGGLLMAMNTVKEELTNLQNSVGDREPNPDELVKYEMLMKKFEELQNEIETQPDRYSTTKVIEATRMMQEALGKSKNGIGKRFLLNIGQQVDNVGTFFETLGLKVFGSDQDLLEHEIRQLGGADIFSSDQSYVPVKNQFLQPGQIFDFSAIQDQINEIKASSLSGEEKQQKIFNLMLSNYSDIRTVQNPNAGKHNWTGMSVLEGMNTVVSQMIPQVAMAYGFAPTSASKWAQFRGTFLSSFMSTYEQTKVEMMRQKVANPEMRAFVSTVITSMSEGINLDLPMFKKMFGQGDGLFSRLANKVTQEEWDAAVKASTGGFKNKFVSALKSAGDNLLEVTKEATTEGIGSGTDAFVGNVAFGEDNDPFGQASDDFMMTVVGLSIPYLSSVPFKYRQTAMDTKYAIWEMGADPERFKAKIKAQFENGELSQEQADHWNTVADRAASAVQATPPLKANGRPMTDSQKAKYAFNNFVSQETAAQSANAPGPLKEKLDEVVLDTETENNDIISGKDDDRIIKEAQKVMKGEPENISQPIELDPRLPEDKNSTTTTQPVKSTKQEDIPADMTVVDDKEVLRQMKPYTDRMAEIEAEFDANGYVIDWDYDNEIQVRDKKTNEILDPEDVPESLLSQAMSYEAATQKLADYDQGLYNKSMESSRKALTTTDAEITTVKKRSARELSNTKPETVMSELSHFFPDKADILRRGIEVSNKLKEIENRGGGKMFSEQDSEIKYPFPYRVYSQEINSRKSTPEKKQEAWNDFTHEVEVAEEYLKNPPSDKELSTRKAEIDKAEKENTDRIVETQKRAKEKTDAIQKVKEENSDFISGFKKERQGGIPKMLAEGVTKDQVELIDKVADIFEKYEPETAGRAFSTVSNFLQKSGFDVEKMIRKIESADTDLFTEAKKEKVISAIRDLGVESVENDSPNIGSYTGQPVPQKVNETNAVEIPDVPTYLLVQENEYAPREMVRFLGYIKESDTYKNDDFDSELFYGQRPDGTIDEFEYFSALREPTYKHIKKEFGKEAADEWLDSRSVSGKVNKNENPVFKQPENPINYVTDLAKKPVIDQDQANEIVMDWVEQAREIGKTGVNEKKVVISLFDYTGNWSKPYHDAGYVTIHFDIQHAPEGKVKAKKPKDLDEDGEDAPWAPADFDVNDMVKRLRNGDRRIFIGMDLWKGYPESLLALKRILVDNGFEVEGILAAPPCTSFASSGAQWWKEQHDGGGGVNVSNEVLKRYGQEVLRRFDSPLEFNSMLVDVTEEWFRVMNPSLFDVMENPRGRIKSVMGLPDANMVFNPNNFGDPYTKETMLWGNFNNQLPTANVSATGGSKIHKLSSTQKVERSTTPEGFAYAFFIANHSKTNVDEKANSEAEERSTRSISTETKVIEAEAKSAKSPKEVQRAIEKVDAQIEKINKKIAKLTESWPTEDIAHEIPSVEVAKMAKKEVTAYAKQVAQAAGWEVGTDNKGKPSISANIPPAGGDITFRLSIPGTDLSMYVAARYNPQEIGEYGEYLNYELEEFFYRVERPGSKGMDQYIGNNQWLSFTDKENAPYKQKAENRGVPTPQEFADILLKEAKPYIGRFSSSEKEVAPAPAPQPKQSPSERATAKKELRKIRDDKAREEIDAAWKEFFGTGSSLTSGGIDPVKLEKGVKIIGLYIKQGVTKFSDIVEDAYDRFGDLVENMFPELKSAYGAYYNNASDEEADQMDGNIRSVKFADIIKPEDYGTPGQVRNTETGSSSGENDGRGNDTRTRGGNSSEVDQGEQAGSVQRTSGEQGSEDQTGEVGGSVPGQDVRSDRKGNERVRGKRGALAGTDGRVGNKVEKSPQSTELYNYRFPSDYNGEPTFNRRRRFEDNIAALELLNTLNSESRPATPEEQEILSKYVGWGGLKQILLDPDNDTHWSVKSDHQYRQYVRESLAAFEKLDPSGKKGYLQAAKFSVNNAHYTSIPIIKGVYSVLKSAGFTGGKVLEPSAGIGNFFAAMPADIASKSRLTAVELDPITGSILKQLQQKADVHVSGLEETSFAPGEFDLVISNVPFGDIPVNDKSFKDKKDKRYKDASKRIHNYFFAKGLDLVRPGGLVAFITSKGTMDSAGNDSVRQLISDQAEFMGAIRLPGTAFVDNAGTEVVTDLIFLRKYMPGEKPVKNPDFLSSESTVVNQDGKDYTVSYNKYYHTNPEMMLGTIEVGGLYRDDEFFLAGSKDEDLQKSIQSLSRRIFDSPVYQDQQIQHSAGERKISTDWAKPGDFERVGNLISFKDGSIGQVSAEYFIDEALDQQVLDLGISPDAIRAHRLQPWELSRLMGAGLDTDMFHRRAVTPYRLGKEKKIAAKKLINIRSAANRLLSAELNNEPDAVLDPLRRALNSQYDKFVKDHGVINSKENRKILELEADQFTVAALEKKDADGNWIKSDILRKRTVTPIRKIEKVDTVPDAILASFNEFGSVNLQYMAGLLGKTEAELLDEQQNSETPLFYQQPDGSVVSRVEYLSGNVRKKLSDATKALEVNPKLHTNVRDLTSVQPEDIPAGNDIHAPMGSDWVPKEYFEQFFSEQFGVKTAVRYNKIDKSWKVDVRGSSPQAEQFKTKFKDFSWIVEHLMNGTTPKVTYTVGEGPDRKTIFDEVDTTLAKKNVEAISKMWDGWKWNDDDRRQKIARIYNDVFNNSVIPQYDGSHMELPGLTNYTLRPHQKDVVWRMLQTGGGIMDHQVGSGKTLCLAAIAIEGKRLGLHRKPAFVGLKAQVPQAYEEFKRAYPNANILYPSAKDFEAKNRKRLLQQIATNDWDAVILTHDQFGMLKQDEDIQAEELHALLSEIDEQILIESDKRKIQSLNNRKKNIEEKISKLSDLKKDREVLGFHELGIDFLMVDESQEFKNLEFTTKHKDIRGLGNQNGSKRAFNMLVAARTIQKKWGSDKGVLFASGTPISNSISEMYSLFRYLRPSLLEEQGLKSLDSWLRVFAEHDTDLEYYMGKFKDVTRLRRFVNVPELITQYRMMSDVRNKQNLILDRPEGRHQLIKIYPSEAQLQQIIKLQRYIATKGNEHSVELGLSKGYDDKKGVNPSYGVLASTYAKKLSMDPRLLKRDFPEGAKLPTAADNIYSVYESTSEDKGVQLVFSDLGTPKSSNPVVALYDYLENLGTLTDTDMIDIFGENFHEKTSKPSMNDIRQKLIEVLEVEPEDVDDVIRDSQTEVPFDVYNEMKRLLIEKGVKPEEIAFIHDHEGDKKRKALYEKVNAGDIRILFGSTKKLGVGVNVQKKAVAAHHLDINWKPADMEQRNGRVERQGNILAKEKYGNKVDIYYYATERLMDASMYELVQAKANFINQSKLGIINGRTTEDLTSDFDAGAMAAELSGDPLHKEISVLRKKIREKENEATAIKSQEFRLKDNIKNAENVIAAKKAELPKAEKALADYKSLPIDPKSENGEAVFTANIGADSFEKVGEAGKKLVENSDVAMKSKPVDTPFIMGTIYDHFRVIGEVRNLPNADGKMVKTMLAYVEHKDGYKMTTSFALSHSDTSAGVQVKRPVTGLPAAVDKIKETIDRNEKNLAQYKKQLSEIVDTGADQEIADMRKALEEKELKVRENLKAEEEKSRSSAPPAEENNTDYDQASEGDDEQASSKKNRSKRIKPAPIEGVKPKDISQIMVDVTAATKQRLFFANPGRRRALGTYSPGNTAIKIKYTNDLDTTAHEIGHSLDDHFGIISDLATTPNPMLEKELRQLANYGGSNPPKGHPDKRMYKLAEGMAEYVRGLVVNPAETKKRYPQITSLYESKVHDEYKKAISQFSDDFRVLIGAKGVDKVLANMEWKPSKEPGWLQELFTRKGKDGNEFHISFADKFKANYLNPFQAFNKAVKYLQGIKGIDELLPADDPMLLARAYIHGGAKVTDVLTNGMVNSKLERLVDKDRNVKNVDWLLGSLDNSDPATLEQEMQETAAYMIAERTAELAQRLGRETRLTGIDQVNDVEAALQILEEFEQYDDDKKARIKEAAARYREMADDTLRYMVDKGRLSEAVYEEIKKNNQYYVGLSRVIEAEPNQEIPNYYSGTGAHLGSVSSPIFKIRGSKRKIVNPYVTLLDGVNKAIRESDRNEVLATFRELLTGTRGMYQGDPKRFADVGFIGSSSDANSIPVFVNGNVEHWVFQKDVYKILKGIDYLHHNLPGWLTALPRLLRWSVTHFPVFAARNIVRDFQSRIIISNENSMANFFGAKDFIGDSKHWKDVALAGGLNSGFYMKDRVHWYGLMKEAIDKTAKKKGITHYLNPIKMYKGYADFLQKGETLNRVAEYRAAFRAAKKEGMDDYNAMLYAGNKSADLIDFALMGHHMKIINQIIPFTNAAVQGLRSAASHASENPVGFTARLVLFTVVPQALLWYLNHKDDDEGKEYEDLPDYQRDMFWNLKIAPNVWVSIPKPFELGMLSSGVDRAMSKAFGKNEKAFDGYGGSVGKSFFPVDEAAIAGPLRSALEVQANWDYFRNKYIIPPHEENLDLRLRRTEYGSKAGQLIGNTMGWDSRNVDHIIKSTLSYYGNFVVKGSNSFSEDGQKLGLPDAGFFKTSPAFNSKSVVEFLKITAKYGFSYKMPELVEYRRLRTNYFDAKTDKEKDQAAKSVRDYCSSVIDSLKLKGEKKIEDELKDRATEKDRKANPAAGSNIDNLFK